MNPAWFAVGLVTVASAGLWLGALRGRDQLVDSATIPWLALALGFAAAEAFVVHVHFRSEATSFSFLEFPLVLGIFFAPAASVWTAMTVGVAISLTLVRRQPIIKAAFNTANLSLQAALCIVIMHAFIPPIDALTPGGWIVAAAATTVSSWTSIGAIVGVIVLTEGRANARRINEMMIFGSMISLTNTALVLLAASLIDYRPISLALLSIPVVVLFAAYRSYVDERAQRERVQFLYRSTSDLRATDRHASIPELLRNSVSMFRAQSADLFLFPDDIEGNKVMRFTSDHEHNRIYDDEPTSTILRSFLADIPKPQLLSPELAGRLAAIYPAIPRTGMIGVLHRDSEPIALFAVVDRLGDVTGFSGDDLALFTTLNDQLALALVNDHLEQEVNTLQVAERELAHKATHDVLTGLADRSVLSSTLDRNLASGIQTSVLYIDLDDFKIVNDSLGHQAGDFVLVETSRRIKAEVRPTDCVARLGGDEFAVALSDSADPEVVARRMIESIHRPMQVAGHEVSVGASIGLAEAVLGQDTASLLANADTAMYAAKALGKGSVEKYVGDAHDPVLERNRLRTSLREALDNDEIAVAYQPIVNLHTGQPVGFEALARWRAPNGPLAAELFITEAEEAGLIVPIDDRVMRQVLDDLPQVLDLAPSVEFLSINLSARNFGEDGLVERITRALVDTGTNPASLVIEITEPAVGGDFAQIARQLVTLRALGVGVALDNFGTGQTSLRSLDELPIDVLKIASSVVGVVETRPLMASGLITLARSLGLTVVAEGIENAAQRDRLRTMGCDLGQGFHLGRPVMRNELEAARESSATTLD